MEVITIQPPNEYDVIELYSDLIYRLCSSKLTGSARADIDDVFQNVYIKYYTAKPVFTTAEHGKAWFIRCTVNCCNDYFRSSARKSDREQEIDDNIPAVTSIPDKDNFQDIIGCLPQNLRVVIYLYYAEQYSSAEIAKILRVNSAVVRMRLSRGRNILKKYLTEIEEVYTDEEQSNRQNAH